MFPDCAERELSGTVASFQSMAGWLCPYHRHICHRFREKGSSHFRQRVKYSDTGRSQTCCIVSGLNSFCVWRSRASARFFVSLNGKSGADGFGSVLSVCVLPAQNHLVSAVLPLKCLAAFIINTQMRALQECFTIQEVRDCVMIGECVHRQNKKVSPTWIMEDTDFSTSLFESSYYFIMVISGIQ